MDSAGEQENRHQHLRPAPWVRLAGGVQQVLRGNLRSTALFLDRTLALLTGRLQAAEAAGLMLSPLDAPSAPSGSVLLATVATERFVPGLAALLGSLKEHHPELEAPFHVFHDGSITPASAHLLASIYPQVRLVSCDPEPYASIPVHPRLGRASYLVFEAFRLEEADRVLYFDSDLLCLGRLDALFACQADFAACCDLGVTPVPRKQKGSDNYIFNTGLLVLGKRHRGAAVFQRLIELATAEPVSADPALRSFADQRILNLYFKDKPVTFLPVAYNTLIRLADSYRGFDLARVRLLHFSGPKPWLPDKKRAGRKRPSSALASLWHRSYTATLRAVRLEDYRSAGELDRILALRGKHRGKRCFILGNGPSLKGQDLSRLSNEITFVSNWFALHPDYGRINPSYYCICSHTVFGGWGVAAPLLNPDLEALLATRAAATPKFFSFRFKECLETASSLRPETLFYLLFEKPFKEFLEKRGFFNLDPAQPLDDGHTVVITFSMFLAHWMGCTEIYLLGCDTDHQPGRATEHFYAAARHTTLKSDPKHLAALYQRGSIFECYRIAGEALATAGVKVYNATEGGALEIFPRVSYATVAPSDAG